MLTEGDPASASKRVVGRGPVGTGIADVPLPVGAPVGGGIAICGGMTVGRGSGFAVVGLLGSEAFDSPAFGGGGRFVRLGGVGAAPGWGPGGLIPFPVTALDVTVADAYLPYTVVVCVVVGARFNASVGPGGRAPGCGAGYVDVPVSGGGTVVVASRPFGAEDALGSSSVFGVAPSAFAALTGLFVKMGMGGIVSETWTSAFSSEIYK